MNEPILPGVGAAPPRTPIVTGNHFDDGYTVTRYLSARPGIHDALLVTFRPMLPEQIEEVDDGVKRSPGRRRISLQAIAIARQLRSWSSCYPDHDGKPDPARPVPITSDTIAALNYLLLADLKGLVWGTMAGDPIPGASPEAESEYMRSLEAELAGKQPGSTTLEADQKN